MQPYLRYALRGLIKRPGRALFYVFIITVGVMLLTGTTIVINGIPEVVRVSYEEAHMADFTLNLRGVSEQIVNDTCSQEAGVSEFEARFAFRSTVHLSRGWPKSAEILLFGVRAPLILNKVTLIQGRFFNGEDEETLIVEHDYGENTLGKDVLVETPFGNATLRVVGTCRAIWMPRWYVSSTVYALVPLKTLQRLLKAENLVNLALVRVKDQSQVKAVMDNLTATLKPYGVVSRSLEGRVVPIVEAEAYYAYLVRLIFLIGLSLFAVGLAMVYSTLSLSISQELREIGTLKTLGATRGKIVLTYLLRGTLLGFLGSLFGVLLGVSAASLLMQGLVSTSLTFESLVSVSQSLMQALVNNQAILILHLLLGIGLSLLLALPPAWAASRTPIAQAVKNFPGLSMVSGNVKKPWPSRGPLFLKYALRSLARRKGREAIVVLVIVISVGLNSTLVAASESQQALVDELSGAINFDFLVYLSRPSNASVVQEVLQALSTNISFSEAGYFTNVKVAGYTLPAIGSRVDTRVFNYFLVEGRWLQNNHEVIFPERLAREVG
ncbi:MAG: FtsX-like permease family protein, partial [Candidatus Bathyarchaeia archaeon]